MSNFFGGLFFGGGFFGAVSSSEEAVGSGHGRWDRKHRHLLDSEIWQQIDGLKAAHAKKPKKVRGKKSSPVSVEYVDPFYTQLADIQAEILVVRELMGRSPDKRSLTLYMNSIEHEYKMMLVKEKELKDEEDLILNIAFNL